MTDWREELIEKMAKDALAHWNPSQNWNYLHIVTKAAYLDEARAALAVAEPVIREQAGIVFRDFSEHKNWELFYKRPIFPDDHDQDKCWAVREISGGRNDREGGVIGKGDTPEQAVIAALTAIREGGEGG